MNFALSDDHELLRRSAADFLDKEIDLSALLKPGATVADAKYGTIWKQIVELGWPGLIVPEEYGGMGLGCIDLAMIVQEMGRTLAPAPLLGTLAGTFALLKTGNETQKDAVLGAVATGGQTLALAVCDKDGGCDGPTSDARASAVDGGYTITGTKSFVIDAAAAGQIIVAAEIGDKRGFFLVDASASGLHIDVLPWRDITRQVCDVTFEGVAAALLCADDSAAWPWVKDRLQLLLSAENAAGLRTVLDMTTTYAKERVAFGRPIGGYQAIKHALADMFGACECADVAVLYASWALAEENPRASLAAAMAKSYSSDAYVKATHQSIQIFGAIGFTWEMKNHLYFKRARSNAELFGSPATQRARVIDLVRAAA